MSEISNHDEVIDSRDVIGEIEALRSNLAEFGPDDEMAETWQEALKALESLADQASDYASDWEYGETLIRDSYFTEYAQELADDLGYMSGSTAEQWPFTCIDWEAAARDLLMDYSAVDFDGVTYWIR